MHKNLLRLKQIFLFSFLLNFIPCFVQAKNYVHHAAYHKKTLAGILNPAISVPAEAIFSGVRGTTSAPMPVEITNTGTAPLTVIRLTVSGTHASAFILTNPQATPFVIAAGAKARINIVFKPSSTATLGVLSAIFNIYSNDEEDDDDDEQTSIKINLYGLSTRGEQGSNEPPLNQIVKTLGYNINVGGTGLILSTGPEAIGDEVLVPLFQKASPGPVTIKAVARYSPDDLLDFGYYTKTDGKPVINKLITIALDQEQTLNPAIVPGGKTSFDPGSAIFGFYTGATSYAKQNTYTEDNLNTGPLPHSARIYPIKNRQGTPVANTYLVTFEPASNGDYQDYVFVVTNLKPADPAPASSGFRINTGGAATTVDGVSWIGCMSGGNCGTFVSGGFSFTQNPVRTISGVNPPLSQYIFQTDWRGGQSASAPIPAGQVAFSYRLPVDNGTFVVRLHFAELGKTKAGERIFDVNIEGGEKELIGFDIFAQAGGMNKAISRDFPVTVTDRFVTIDFIKQLESAKINAIEIIPSAPITLEAETARLNLAKIASNHSGFTGTGFVDYINASGEYIEWSVNRTSGGTVSVPLQFRYANGSQADRPLRLEVNGTVVSASLSFPPTGSWTTWQQINRTATMVEGTNKIRLISTGASGPNIDHLLLENQVTAANFSSMSALLDDETMPKQIFQATIYPNPAAINARIVLNNPSELPVDVQILDAMGKNHKTFSFKKNGTEGFDFSVYDLPSGVYTLVVQQGSNKTSTRFIVEGK